MDALIELTGLGKTYVRGDMRTVALEGVDIRIDSGEYVAIMGPSGSGKSTLMGILGCLDGPTEGRYRLEGKEVPAMGEYDLALIRNRLIGFVFQSFNLLPRRTAQENVELPLVYRGVPPEQRRNMAREALTVLGLEKRMTHRPSELSGGQQQRVAVARALVTRPKLLLADEPTGNLDSRAGDELMELLGGLNSEGLTIVLVTHEEDVARRAGRILRFRDGRMIADERIAGVGA